MELDYLRLKVLTYGFEFREINPKGFYSFPFLV
jgi:hypothetical protein